jgi:L-seryl-tRNA(Ser) seleniumtransferase
LSAAFRALPIPVIGVIAEGALRFDARCLDDEAAFVTQLAELVLP